MIKREAKAILEEYLALDDDIQNEFVDAMRVAIDALDEKETTRFVSLMEKSIAKSGGGIDTSVVKASLDRKVTEANSRRKLAQAKL